MADSVRPLSVNTGPDKGAEHQRLWLTAVGFAHLEQVCSLPFGVRCGNVISVVVVVSVTHLRGAVRCTWLLSLMSVAEYKGYTDAKLLVKVSRY